MSKKSNNKDLIRTADEKGLVSFLREALHEVDALTTGAFGTNRLHLMMIPGRLVQAARNHSFVHQLAKEFEELRQKGKIEPEFESSEIGKACLQELLAALEEPPVDEKKFAVLKAIFFAAASVSRDQGEDVTPQLLMSIARQLSSGETLLLATVYEIVCDPKGAEERATGASAWIHEIIQRSTFGIAGLVEVYEDQLIQKRLLTPRQYGDRSGIVKGPNFRLTDLGMKLCSFIKAGTEMPTIGNNES